MAEDPFAERIARVREAEAAVLNSTGHRAYRRWVAVRRMIEVHRRNLYELTDLLDHIAERLGTGLSTEADKTEFTTHLDQRLHNALASAVATVGQVSTLLDNYEGTQFAAEFTRRNAAIWDQDRTKFVRRFRNYLLHATVAPFTYKTSRVLREAPHNRSTVVMRSDHLRVWKDWSADAKRYLDSVETVDLGELMRWYRDASLDLYKWLIEQYDELHADDTAATNELIAERNRIAEREGFARPPDDG